MRSQTALPLYVQLSELLIREIRAGRLRDGERLPPEREMAQTLNTSVGTLRKALADLTEKGMLDRIQGSGNYVRAKEEAISVYAFLKLELKDGGGLPTAEILSVERLPKPADFPGFGPSEEGHRIRRLRKLNGQPAAVEEIWLDGSHARRIPPEDLSESLYLYYRTRLGLWIARAEDKVGVSDVPDWAPAAFGLAPGAASGFIERISWSRDETRVEYSRTWFDHTTARYIARLK
ncbi:GntR family transcriptional regulator [Pseudoruegeria sp. SHC-113]|uniref:GntR family transcriptional regulator n=1 Tax=Pseudoruegeria sp. SHC-113 TaxID=2855439 RepID=UPI0021BAF1F2|nr:GntR family transcriptional regulator [Pseudoruegeria sp. SHC-113]MCT8160827.1 GntR family transcriptional regulator [Pseudoruegeria sp. SHC-113]